MKPLKALLDTDILSAVMKKHPAALTEARKYLRVHRCFTFSIITRYEVLRGLKARHATTQLSAFERLCQTSHVISLTDEMIIKAADLYADLKERGELI